MKRLGVLAAAIVVLVSNLWVCISARHNRSEALGGTLELTERELELPPLLGESTALLLDLRWSVVGASSEELQSPDWLTPDRLAGLGFDCRVPLTDPKARDHYTSLPPVPAYFVLGLREKPEQASESKKKPRTQLLAVDVGRDPRRLRERYPDPQRHIIVRGVVRLGFQEHQTPDGTSLPEPRLRGWLQTVLPQQIFVPPPFSQVLQGLRRNSEMPEPDPDQPPRFAVSVSWGRHYEPWVRSVRLLPQPTGQAISATSER